MVLDAQTGESVLLVSPANADQESLLKAKTAAVDLVGDGGRTALEVLERVAEGKRSMNVAVQGMKLTSFLQHLLKSQATIESIPTLSDDRFLYTAQRLCPATLRL